MKGEIMKLEMRGVMGGMWNRVANYSTRGKRFATAACFGKRMSKTVEMAFIARLRNTFTLIRGWVTNGS